MKRKLLTLVLALAMVLTMLPMTALAANGDVAVIGSTSYATLEDALLAAEAGDTITLLADVETKNIADTSLARLVISKPITLNLNDKKIISPNDMGNNSTNFAALYVAADTTINATATGGIDTGKNGGYGINVISGATLTVNGGTYYGGGTAIQVQKGALVINDGYFNCAPYDEPYGYKYLINCIDKAWKNGTAKVSIKGGSFERFDPSDSASENPNGNFVASGYAAVKGGTEELPVWTVEDRRAAVVNNDVGYSTLAAAVAAAKTGDTVTLLKNIDFGTDRLTIRKAITLDLAGHSITTNNTICNLYFTNAATIMDSIGGGEIANTDRTSNGIGVVSGGETADLTLKGVKVSGLYGVYIQQGANVTVIDSEISAAFCGIAVLGQSDSSKKNTTLTVQSGTVEGEGYAIAGNGTAQGTEITITGGTIRETGNEGGGAIYHPQNGTLNISGNPVIEGENGIQLCSGEGVIANIEGGYIRATGEDRRASKTDDGYIPDGAAISVVNRSYPGGTPKMNISGGCFSAAKNDAVLAYTWSNNQASEWTNAREYLTLTGGHYTSDPTAYKADGLYTVASDVPGYVYTLSTTAPSAAPIVADDATATDNKIADTNAKNAVDSVIDNASSDGVADAVKPSVKQEFVNKSNVDDATKTDPNTTILVEVTVTVTAKDAEATTDGSTTTFAKLTYEATPTAIVKVNGVAKSDAVLVSNSDLSGQTFTISLPLPAGFEPIEIMHISSDGTRERFLKEGTEGAVKTFKVENGCAVVAVNKFSEFVLSGTQTVAAKIGDTTYGTLQDAINAAKNGDEILLLDGFDAAEKVAISGKSLTIVAGGKAFHLENVTLGAYTTITVGYEGRYFVTYNPPVTVTPSGTPAKQPYQDVAKRFDDVPADAWFATAVYYAANNGLMNGTGDNLFSPNAPTTRGMIMTILARKSGVNTSGTPWYAAGMNWAKNAGVSDGTNPTAAVTREQLVTMLYRYAALNGMDAVTLSENLTSFADASSVSSWAVQAMQWAVGQGLIEGSNQLLRPQATATRAEVATILMRFCELLNQ